MIPRKQLKQSIQLLSEISDVIGVTPPFILQTTHFPEEELENILDQLRNFERPENFEVKGERPRSMKSPSEWISGYRRKMSEYIELNTGIKIPVSSVVSARFYNSIADYLGL